MHSLFDPTDEEAGYPEEPRCPLCHERCDTIYRTDDGAIVGCDRCIEAADAWKSLSASRIRSDLCVLQNITSPTPAMVPIRTVAAGLRCGLRIATLHVLHFAWFTG